MSAPAISIESFNALPEGEAAALMDACCGASGWVQRMVASRPFADRAALLHAADRIWSALTAADWREAFDGHPRIGHARAGAPVSAIALAWSTEEQSDATRSDKGDRTALFDAQRAYEARFGHIFLVCAAGRTSPELLGDLQARLLNEPDTELRVAAEEQRKITRLRLERLIVDIRDRAS